MPAIVRCTVLRGAGTGSDPPPPGRRPAGSTARAAALIWSPAVGDIESVCSLSGSIVLDDRYEPIVIATWYDAPEQHAIRRFFEWNLGVIERARRTGGYVLISDANNASRPAGLERKLIAELTDAMPADAVELAIGNYVVVDNALIRGAMAAMQWLSRTPWTAVNVATHREALERAMQDLARAEMRPPAGLDPEHYRPPDRPD